MIIIKRRENVNYPLFIVTIFRRYMIKYEQRTSAAIEIVNLRELFQLRYHFKKDVHIIKLIISKTTHTLQ